MYSIHSNFIDNGQEIDFYKCDRNILSSIKEQFSGHECVKLHEWHLFFIIEYLYDIDDGLIDEHSKYSMLYISFFLNCRT